MESMKHCFMESSWSPLYFRQSLWTPCGVYGDYWELVGNAVWSPHRLYMESPWSLHGVHVDIYVESMWTPWKPVGECKVLEACRGAAGVDLRITLSCIVLLIPEFAVL